MPLTTMSRGAVDIIVALLLVGVLGPIALQMLATGNYTLVPSIVKTIFQILIPVLAGVGIALKFLGYI
jgi:hypothetical protein